MKRLTLSDDKIKAAVVMRNGEILAEADNTDKLYPQYSITKSLVSLCIGMLIDDGRLSLKSTVGEILGTPAGEPLSSVTLEELLTMRSGLNTELLFADRRTCPDYLAACFSQKTGEKTAFYNNADAYLAGRMAEEVYGKPLENLMISRIFKPLGITEFEFEHDPQRHFFGASGLMLTTRDLAKLGNSICTQELYPKTYLELATHTQTRINTTGYGYFFWTGRTSFYMSGKWGQKCFVYPERAAVIAINSDNTDVLPTLYQELLPIVGGLDYGV